MVNGLVAAKFRPRDLGFEPGNPRVAIGNGQRVEVLPCKERHRIASARGRCDVVGIHVPKVRAAFAPSQQAGAAPIRRGAARRAR